MVLINQIGLFDFNNVTVSVIKTDSALIQWDTIVPATGRIEYGLSTSYGNTTKEVNFRYWHYFEVTGLIAGTTYHYRIIAKDIDGNETISNDSTFTTRTQAQLDSVIQAARVAQGGTGLPKTYYVKTDGNDTLDGLSTANAWKSSSTAVSRAYAGDTVMLMDGIWYDERIIFSRSGIDVAPITLTAYNSMPTLDGVNKTGYAINLREYSYIKISKLKILNYDTAVMNLRSYFYISDCEIAFQGGIGIMIGGDHAFIDNCSVHDTGWNAIQETGHSSVAKYMSITNNTVWIAGHSAIDINDGTPTGGGSFYLNVIGNDVMGIFTHNSNPTYLAVNDNVVHDNAYNAVYVEGTNVIFYKNIVYNVWGTAAFMSYVRSYNAIYLENIVHDVFYNAFLINGENISFIRNNLSDVRTKGEYDYRVYGDAVVRDPVYKGNTVVVLGGIVDVEFTDNRVFSGRILNGDSITPYWYSDKSYYRVDNKIVTFIFYPMTARPASGSATVTVNNFDTSLVKPNILVDITVATTSGNSINFTVTTLKSNTEYSIKLNTIQATTGISDINGDMNFYLGNLGTNNRITINEIGPAPNTGTLNVSTIPVNGDIYVDNTLMGNGSISITISAGTHTIRFGNVINYTTPQNQNVDIVANQIIDITGVYTLTCPIPICDIIITQL